MYILKDKRIYFALLALFIITFTLRAATNSPSGFFYQHISNFSITGGAYLLLNYELLFKKGFTKKSLLLSAAPFAVLNIVIELVRVDTIHLPLNVNFVNFNTPDPVDMLFGLAALALILAVIFRSITKMPHKN